MNHLHLVSGCAGELEPTYGIAVHNGDELLALKDGIMGVLMRDQASEAQELYEMLQEKVNAGNLRECPPFILPSIFQPMVYLSLDKVMNSCVDESDLTPYFIARAMRSRMINRSRRLGVV